MRRSVLVAAALSWCLPIQAHARNEPFGVRMPRNGMVVDVPYSMGTHHERVTSVQGILRIDPERLQLEGGRLLIPLASFQSDDPKRECHLREALGLDYSRSRYPKEHVCDDANHLPASGPDAIAYPQITLELRPAAGKVPAGAGPEASTVEVEGSLMVHGVTRPIRIALKVSREEPDGMLRVRGRVPLRLSDFGVTVKSAGVLFVTISVRDEVAVNVDTLLEPLRRPAVQ